MVNILAVVGSSQESRHFSDERFNEIKKTRITPCDGRILSQYFVYDKTTKIVYVLQNTSCYGGITPYYILDENGKPEIAVYGENYNG